MFPCNVAAAHSFTDCDPADLLPLEAKCVQDAVPKRILEFAAGRSCARLALRSLGLPDSLILPAADRQPIWPAGIVGSITHTAGYCAAVVARCDDCIGLGIDSEQVGGVNHNILNAICLPAEMSWMATLSEHDRACAGALLFSAKEAFYKCQYPLTSEWLEFHDAHVVAIDWATEGAFRVSTKHQPGRLAHLQWPVIGRYLFHDSWVTTAMAFPNVSRLA